MAHAAGLLPARGATGPARRVPNTTGHSPGVHRPALAISPTRANKTPPDHGLERRRRAGHLNVQLGKDAAHSERRNMATRRRATPRAARAERHRAQPWCAPTCTGRKPDTTPIRRRQTTVLSGAGSRRQPDVRLDKTPPMASGATR